MKEKEINKNNIKIASGLFENFEEVNKLDYHKSWDSLIPAFQKYREANLSIKYSDLSNIGTLFMLGVSANNIEKSYNAMIQLINWKKLRTPVIFQKQIEEMKNKEIEKIELPIKITESINKKYYIEGNEIDGYTINFKTDKFPAGNNLEEITLLVEKLNNIDNHKANVESGDDNTIFVCWGEHDRNEKCEYIREI